MNETITPDPTTAATSFATLHPSRCSALEWGEMVAAIRSGAQVEVGPAVYDYFLEVLPPRHMIADGYVFAEGEEFPTLYTRCDGRYFAQHFRPAGAGWFADGYLALADHLGLDGWRKDEFLHGCTGL
jgi:hypothetical protein